MTAYYNEIDPFAAQWLRNLVAAGHIASGEVDERSIVEVRASDLAGFDQCHFFAGIGVWSYALRLAGWPDGRKVWTGSCPCQPFSQAGARAGFADQRHLWPVWFALIKECRPAAVFGEQVASPDGLEWLDAVSSDMERAGYAFGAADLCSAGVGAPHIRQRLHFVAYAADQGRSAQPERADRTDGRSAQESRRLRDAGELGDAGSAGLAIRQIAEIDGSPLRLEGATLGAAEPLHGFWRGADWIWCRDGKYRPVEPGTFPLAHGAAARVGRLRAYGNAINPHVAKEFIEAAMPLLP